MTDPRGIVTQTTYDNLGRTTKTIDDYTNGTPTNSSNQTTEYTYDGEGHTLTVKADLPGGAYQTTQYVYGVTTLAGSNINSNDILSVVEYPDPTTGNPSSAQEESYTVDALGEVTFKLDRNGNSHYYTFDVLGRETAEQIGFYGSPVDQTVGELATAYDTGDRPYLYTSYSPSGAVVNQVEDVYNGLGQLITEYQFTSGPVNTSTTPKVQYAYTQMAGGVNNSRIVSMTYPNGRVLNYNYNTGVDNTISRLSSISDSSGTLEAYTYLGLSTVVKRAHPQSGVDLTYIAQSGQPTGDAGDQYIGLDRFGRVVDQRWLNSSTGAVADEFTYGYDQDSNVLYRGNQVNSAFGELYHANGASNGYDGLNRETAFARGTLSISSGNTVPDTIANPTASESWSLDALGNWSSFTTGSTTQTRTANQQNEITSVSGATTPTYDMNGNMTTDQTGKTLIYDAWNRLVEVKSGSTVLEVYSYDALGRRITETPNGSPTKSLYYSSSWQVLEEDWSGATQVQYVWSAVYVDAMVERDRGNERLYVLQDANWNVTALVNTSGAVQERYVYDPYGQVTVLDPNWNVRSSSSFVWVYLHQGGRYDTATGLYSFRKRDYSPVLGRWIEVDPLGLGAGDANLYLYEGNSALTFTDPGGTTRIEVKMDAFINGRLGAWLPEPPVPFSSWFFHGDERDFGGPFNQSKVRSWFTIDTSEIGHAQNVDIQTATGLSIRRKRDGSAYQSEVDQTTPKTSYSVENGKCFTKITVAAAAHYPFYWYAPDIDYKFVFYFYVTSPGKVDTKIGYNHNQFPDYEVLMNGDVIYAYQTKDSGPGFWNLAIGPNVSGVKDGLRFQGATSSS